MTNLGPNRNWSWPVRLGVATGALALVFVLGRVLVMTPKAEAHADMTFTVLYSFNGGTDGAQPHAGLVRDAAGNLYGTTIRGGGASNFGTVFKLDTTGAETVLYSFTGFPDGANPRAGLVLDAAGNLYGTTYHGGASDLGTVFKLDTNGAETVLHSFSGRDGQNPYAGLVRDAAGNFYGTTQNGGDFAAGTVFKLDTTGKETVLHSFAGGSDGASPYAGLLRDAAGNLYGTTLYGSAGEGTVFKLDPTGKETVLHSFIGRDGSYPLAGLIRDAAGNLYGSTRYGGDPGPGTVFKLDTTGKETVLHSFAVGPDGIKPYAGLIRDAAGNLYGTTYQGGDFGFGTVFKLDATGNETVLYSFTGGADGGHSRAGLIRDASGNLYGTTSLGGAFSLGTVFKLSR